MSHRYKKLCTAFLFVLSISTVFFGATPQPARAQIFEAGKCSPFFFQSVSVNGRMIPSDAIPTIDIPTDSLNVTFTQAVEVSGAYTIRLYSGEPSEVSLGQPPLVESEDFSLTQGANHTLTLDLSGLSPPGSEANRRLESMDLKLYDLTGKELCQIADINATAKLPMCDGIQIVQSRLVAQTDGSPPVEINCRFNINGSSPSCVEAKASGAKTISVIAKGLRQIGGDPLVTPSEAKLALFKDGQIFATETATAEISGGIVEFPPVSIKEFGKYKLVVGHGGWDVLGGCKDKYIDVVNGCLPDQCSTLDVPITPITPGTVTPSDPFSLCKQASKTIPSNTPGLSQFAECQKCVVDPTNVKGVWTAVGCIKTEPQAIIRTVVQIGIGLGGGIALLMTLVGGFLLTTSQGDPKRTQEGKDMVTSSVIGIVFVLFSVVILQFIGVTVLRLPGFGGA